MAVDTNKCLKRFSVHLEGMSRRLKLLWGCVSSLERGWEALSKMKISSVSHWCILLFFLCHAVLLAFSHAMWKYVWICQGQLHSAPHWMQTCIIFHNLIYLAPTVVCIHHDRSDSRLTPESHMKKSCMPGISRTDLFMFSVRWGSKILATQTKSASCFSAAGRTVSVSRLNMQVDFWMFPETRKDLNPNSWSFSMRTEWTDSNKWRVGGKQSNVKTLVVVFLQEGTEVAKKINKKNKKHNKTSQYQTAPKEAAYVLYLTKKRWAFLSGLLIQLKINTGNEAASLSKWAASLLFLCMWLGEDSAGCVARLQHKLLWFFWPRPSQACVLCSCPYSISPCQPKTRIIAG